MPTRIPFPVLTALLLLPAAAIAADTAAPASSLLQLVFGFLLILVLLFATLWVLKKLSVTRGVGGGLIRVVSAAAVGPRERVVVVDVGGERLVLGVAPGQVSLLSGQPLPPEAGFAAENNMAAVPDFALWLKKTLARRNEK